MKNIFLGILFLVITNSTYAGTSALSELPFGIKIGVTKNSEIENKGVCIQKIKVSDSYYRCEIFDMLNGKFLVKSSQNEIVNAVFFGSNDLNHQLPQNWRNLKIKLCPKYSSGVKNISQGTSRDDFIDIILANGAENMHLYGIDERSGHNHYGRFYFVVEFDIEGIHHTAKFERYDGYETSDVYYDYGLVSIEVTEAY